MYASLPTFRTRTPQPVDPLIRLSCTTKRTEESRSVSGPFSTASHARPTNPTPDALCRSTIIPDSTPSSSHSCSSTDFSGDRTLPPSARATELIAILESQAGNHSQVVSAPSGGRRVGGPFPTSAPQSTTGYGYGSRPSSPSKSSGSPSSFTGTET